MTHFEDIFKYKIGLIRMHWKSFRNVAPHGKKKSLFSHNESFNILNAKSNSTVFTYLFYGPVLSKSTHIGNHNHLIKVK